MHVVLDSHIPLLATPNPRPILVKSVLHAPLVQPLHAPHYFPLSYSLFYYGFHQPLIAPSLQCTHPIVHHKLVFHVQHVYNEGSVTSSTK